MPSSSSASQPMHSLSDLKLKFEPSSGLKSALRPSLHTQFLNPTSGQEMPNSTHPNQNSSISSSSSSNFSLSPSSSYSWSSTHSTSSNLIASSLNSLSLNNPSRQFNLRISMFNNSSAQRNFNE